MAIVTTDWRPDTCSGCEVQYTWDNTTSENTRVHTFKGVKSSCSTHAQLGLNGQALYSQILAENQAKNKAFAAAQVIKPDLTPDEMTYSFDANRNLVVNFPALSAAQNTSIQAAVPTLTITKALA